ncbi:MAG: transcriptional repressor [Clostridia bacterium]|nr:transcriptional repressor [Clostridia bacterium]
MTYNTEKRTEILNFFSEARSVSHSAEEICRAILTDGRGKSTVYRIISKLVDEGVINRITDQKTRRVTYQYMNKGACHEHLHLKCKECGKLIHLDDKISEVLEKRIKSLAGFEVDDGAMLYGKCEVCRFSCGEVKL